MLGNLSQTIVQVPNFFQLLTKLSSKEFAKTRYREPPLLDTFSQLKNINSNLNKRYFRVNDHFKGNSPYKDLNYNNNKRYMSPVTKLMKRTFEKFLCLEIDREDFKRNLNRNHSQAQIIQNNNIENNRYDLQNNLNDEEKNKLDDNLNNNNEINNEIINENNKIEENNDENNNLNINSNNDVKDDEKNNENNDNEDNIKDDNNEKKRIQKYITKLQNKRPKNVKELKEFLDNRYMEEKKKSILPKIKGMNKSLSQDDLFKKTIEKKIESLTMIKPEVKYSIYKRRKNIMLKKDYDLLQKIYANHRKFNFSFRNNIYNSVIH